MKRRRLAFALGVVTVGALTYIAWLADRLSPLFVVVAIASLVFSYRMDTVTSLRSGLTDIVLMAASTSFLFFLLVGFSWPLIAAVLATAAVLSRLPSRLRAAHKTLWDGDIILADPATASGWNSENHKLLESESFEALCAYSHSSPAVSKVTAFLMVNRTSGIYAELHDEGTEAGYGLATQYAGGWLTTGKIKAIPPKDEDLAQVFPDESLATLLRRHREAMAYLASQGLHPVAVSRDAYMQRVSDMIDHVRRILHTTPTRYTFAIERMKRTGDWFAAGPISRREDLAVRIERMRG